ncbi:MAG: ABC transporter related protein [Desulfotomaculum sp. 46_296]|nr:MAG: ABC transporter related protein [Desulfotomaculum sp. 46_296]
MIPLDYIGFNHVYKSFGQTSVLDDFSFSVPAGRIICLIGPSGCGKTTILNLLTGLEQPDRGYISGTANLRISCVFQETRLLPWKTVSENISFVLQDLTMLQRQKLIDLHLKAMGLYEYRNSYPKTLSGGMKQRLALCRAFAFPHDLLLLDEPFKSLDVPLRMELVQQVAGMWIKNPRTIVFVTHDILDALLLGHFILVLSAKPTTTLDTLEINIPPGERVIAEEPFPAYYNHILALLEGRGEHEHA